MTTAPLEQLPATLNRRNWSILALLLLASLPFARPALTVGILAGGLVAVAGFAWMQRSLRRLLAEPGAGGRFRFQFGYLIRLVALAVCLGLLIAVVRVDPLGLIIGLSVVVINLLILTIERVLRA
ncbi:MAG: ATP synthase subunit I [Desulfuromonadales bacterium]|nr:ATP synthase subunit I [Desulfuromonadales bacterium]